MSITDPLRFLLALAGLSILLVMCGQVTVPDEVSQRVENRREAKERGIISLDDPRSTLCKHFSQKDIKEHYSFLEETCMKRQ